MKSQLRIAFMAGVVVVSSTAGLGIAEARSVDAPSSSPSAKAVLTVREKNAAIKAGVNPDTASKEEKNGLTLISDSKGWVVVSDSASTSTPATNRSFDFDVEAGLCAGRFYAIRVVNNVLEWGAEDSCISTASPNDLYPHKVTALIRQGNLGVLSWQMHDKVTAVSPASSAYSRVASVHATKRCADNNLHKFDMVVTVSVHGTVFRPHVSPEARLNCGI